MPPQWTIAHQAPLSSTIPQNFLKFMLIASGMSSNHFIFSYTLLSLPSIFPSIRLFSNESALCIRWTKYWSFSYSINPSLPPDTCTTEHHFCFGPATSFFQELLGIAPHSSLVSYWTLSDLKGPSSSVISFCFFTLLMRFLQQEYWSSLPLPPPVDHILSELSTMTCPSWVALHSMAHSFIDSCKPLCHYKAVIHEREKVMQRMSKAISRTVSPGSNCGSTSHQLGGLGKA